jgi:UDP-N-acetylglucosamine--N-acetylmuramyl-(pentapeptide) pyrophosphoryl-undecaprenol N-acetylglucosamine transferase
VLILGGSQGAQAINDVILEALPLLLEKFQVIHQTGEANIEAIRTITDVILENNSYVNRYRPFGYLNDLALRMSAGAADVIVSRSGAGAIFEIATWRKPAILIPIPEDVSRDQRQNAYAYARTGAAVVIEQENLTPHVIVSEISRVVEHLELQEAMRASAEKFHVPDAARKIAEEIVALCLKHEL